jgi:hypothetical protein
VAVGVTRAELDTLEDLIASCPDGTPGHEYNFGREYGHYRFTMSLLLYATMGCLTASVLYYIEKPKKSASKEHIQKWWRRGGRVVFVMMLVSTAVSIWALLYQSNWLLQFYTIATSDFCDDTNNIYYSVGYFTTLFSFVVCFYLML